MTMKRKLGRFVLFLHCAFNSAMPHLTSHYDRSAKDSLSTKRKMKRTRMPTTGSSAPSPRNVVANVRKTNNWMRKI